MSNKIIGTFIITLSVVLSAIIVSNEQITLERFLAANPDENKAMNAVATTTIKSLIQQRIDEDLTKGINSKEIPKEFSDIATYEVIQNSQLANILMSSQKLHFKTKENGKYHLEVEVMDLEDDHNPGFILQMSLFDITNNNKVEELGKTYTMKTLNQIQEE